jgi:aspartyl-tRNA(Asn)/glutamyl-tRNA(Gln) amidotransferase subunit A
MVHVDAEGALARADELDALLVAGHAPLALHGIPIVIKEIYSVAGMPDSSGSRLPTPGLFQPEGALVRRLRQAGCVILGKSLSTEFAFAQVNLDRTMPVNPVALSNPSEIRATGGSSAGSAAAQAAGYCGFAVGTDTGGSVRGPAALCGVVGFKPSESTLPTDGIFPLSTQLDTPGFFCNSVADAAMVFTAVGGTVNHARRASGEIRVGTPTGELSAAVDREIASSFGAALGRLRTNGIRLVEMDMPSLQTADCYFSEALPRELLERLGVEHVADHLDLLDPVTRARLTPALTAMQSSGDNEPLHAARRAAQKCFEKADVDCWLIPTVPCTAPLQSELQTVGAALEWQKFVSRNTRYTSLLGHAAISLPLPVDICGELPVALQLAVPAGSDGKLLRISACIEAVLAA